MKACSLVALGFVVVAGAWWLARRIVVTWPEPTILDRLRAL